MSAMHRPAVPEGVEVVLPPPLRFLLPPRDRSRGARRMGFDPDATVGHVVEAAGVPLTEVGELRLESTIEVTEAPRPQPGSPGGFLLDVGLGALARRLRLLGLDAGWSNDADDPDLVVRAAAEDRVLLTQDRRLLMRRALRRGALVRGSRPDDQLADVLDRFALEFSPLTRCTACGGVLAPVDTAEVAHLLEPGTVRSYAEFVRCRSCRRVYWHGAHAARIDAIIRTATRR